VFAGATTLSGSAFAGEWASKDEAQAMVRKTVTFIKEDGPEKAYAEISNKAAPFTDRDLYVVVYQLDGKVLAHGANQKLVGKDLSDTQDVDGKFFVKERIELARLTVNGSGDALTWSSEKGTDTYHRCR